MSGVRIATLFERFMEIHSNPPILYYGFKEIFEEIVTIMKGYFCRKCNHL